ncbi:BRCT domain-containing protein [Dactylonectria macrodidyma]|uniref:BRCT domain-containing protein n=1 Tax=Dactylonectria macrodidyma TaxID=307937 RepID=A0A9P9ENR5_9HYPO|nr:BRCT domain-containing protein [Dactylonectria macrodidyma]
MASPNPAGDEFDSALFDPAHPLKGIIVCCTSIPPDQRASIASKVAELGGVHKYDLTPDVTHLVVGDYDTPKYRHVARERPDIKAMDAAWIEALSELWKNDDDINFREVESNHQLKPLEKRGIDVSAPQTDQPPTRDSLLICLTGFGDQRDDIANRITAAGGSYTGDLTRRCTHLIVSKPEGKKFAAAKLWGIYAVTLAWLDQTIARGMILEETKFDPTLPPEEQGKDAWIKKDPRRAAWGKRSRSAMANATEDGPRKLRKTASMKLNSQRNNLWGDILGRSTSREYSFAHEQEKPPTEAAQARVEQPPAPPPAPTIPVLQEKGGVFLDCYFFVHGFTPQRTSVLEQTIATLGGTICSFLHEAALGPYPSTPLARFLIVPQTSQPDTHPPTNYDHLYVVTEYYIEKCLHTKQFFNPNEHVLGRPFPLFPIPSFSDLTVCSAAFTGIELNQVARSLAQLGAKFEEEFRKGTSVLVCKTLASIRKEKLRMALKWGVPVVSADWLWECISTGFKVPLEDFIFPELKSRYDVPQQQPPKPKPVAGPQPREVAKPIQRTHSEPFPRTSKVGAQKPPGGAGVDTTAFDHDSPDKPRQKPAAVHDSFASADFASADFATALTHPAQESFPQDADFEGPLTEVSSARLNKSPSPTKHTLARTRSEPIKAPQPTPPAVDPAVEAKLREQQEQQEQQRIEAARKQAKAAERQALSSKLTSLIEATGSTAASATTTSNLAANGPEGAPDPNPVPRPRRRAIFGRATSNVSNASSDAARSDSLRDSEAAATQQEPPATQLEYRDPRAQECKAALMSRMMGGSGEAKQGKSTESVAVASGRSMRRR